MTLIRLGDYAQGERISYNRALDRVLRGIVPARRVGARWWVEVSEKKRRTGTVVGCKRGDASSVGRDRSEPGAAHIKQPSDTAP